MPKIEKFKNMQVIRNDQNSNQKTYEFLSEKETENARRIHSSIDEYECTPLINSKQTAEKYKVKAIFVKDESKRFGLNAFKGLGGVYALFCVVCRELGLDYKTTSLKDIASPKYRDKLSHMEFVTATDGNHGKGISWAAGKLGLKAHVFMPRGSAEVRAQAIRDAGKAEVEITNFVYDDTVRYAEKKAKENGWFLVQDTSSGEYLDEIKWIAQGYTTLLYEALSQMKEEGIDRPTHVFLQAGVGAMAGSITGALKCIYGDDMPCVSIAEPENTACIFESVYIGDGKPHTASGNNITIMAGLNCGEPCHVTWPILRDLPEYYFSCADSVAERGMRVLAAPYGNDPKIISGESGAVTAGVLSLLLHDEEYKELRKKMNLDMNSVILLISTEGDTDPDNYFDIVYNGKTAK